MELPSGVNPVDVSDEIRHRYVLKLYKNLFGFKQACYDWFEKLREGLIAHDLFKAKLTSVCS